MIELGLRKLHYDSKESAKGVRNSSPYADLLSIVRLVKEKGLPLFVDSLDEPGFHQLLFKTPEIETKMPDIKDIEHRMTPEAKRVILQARNEALGLNHGYVGTEHLLLALAMLMLAREFPQSKLTPASVISAIREFPGVGEKEEDPEKLSLSPSFVEVIKQARNEADRRGLAMINTKLLLVGLTNTEGDNVISRIFETIGVDKDVLRKAVAERLASVVK